MRHPRGSTATKPVALHHLAGQLFTDDDVQCEHWYEAFPPWPQPSHGGPTGTTVQWTQVAEDALASSSRMYEKRMNSSSRNAVKRALGKEKTIADKIAAVTLVVQESPVHRIDELRTLLSFAQKKVRRERAPAIEALNDLFLNDLLPPDRRLVFFSDREFSCAKGDLTKRHLVYALFENELKSVYREFLQILEESGKDSVAFFKQKVVKIIAGLLIAKPEGERILLTMLVNKLGDPDRKVSSSAAHSLLQLIQKHHPQMRLIVVKEVEQLLTRPNVTRKTQYYAVGFLNQIRFSHEDVELARKFVRIYMDLFTVCLHEERKGETAAARQKVKKILKRPRKRKKSKKTPATKLHGGVEAKETKLMGALLVGVNRAFPYTKPEEDDSSYQEHYDALFYVAHAKSLGSAVHALAFLFQVSQTNSAQSNRFYRALYSRVYDAAEAGEATQAAFLNLTYKAVKSDTNTKRIKAFMKRLLQAASEGTAGFAGASLVVISELFSAGKKGLVAAFLSLPEKDDEEEEFQDADHDVMSSRKHKHGSDSTAFSSDEDVEQPVNGKHPKESSTKLQTNAGGQIESTPKAATGVPQTNSRPSVDLGGYDPRKRDPQYSGAEKSSLWEAVALSTHFHPSVSLFAKTICVDTKPVSYEGDPLKDFAQMAFLDRFSYKKPKNRIANSLYGKRSSRYRDGPLANSEEFQKLVKAGHVAHDDVFLAKFFSANPEKVQRPLVEIGIGKEPGWDVDSEEEAFEKAMEAEMRRLGGNESMFARGTKEFVGDIDEEDEDEMKAFEKAFENEMVDSEKGAESDDSADSDMEYDGPNDSGHASIMRLPDEESDDQIEGTTKDDRKPHSRKKGRLTVGSAFAAAEDYADAIDQAEDERREGQTAERTRSRKGTRNHMANGNGGTHSMKESEADPEGRIQDRKAARKTGDDASKRPTPRQRASKKRKAGFRDDKAANGFSTRSGGKSRKERRREK